MRDQLLQGILPLPSVGKFIKAIGHTHTKTAQQMWNAMWHNYLANKSSTSLTYWSEQFNDPKTFNIVLIALSNAGWITTHSIPARNWAEAHINEDKLLEFVEISELEDIRAYHKFQKYTLQNSESTLASATRINGKTRNTGLIRDGFRSAGNSKFSYDKNMLHKYEYTVQRNLTKSMDKIAEIWPELRHDKASYDRISMDMMEYYQNHEQLFTRGNNYNDSRGRAISSSLGKIGNPISCKDFRALLVIPDA